MLVVGQVELRAVIEDRRLSIHFGSSKDCIRCFIKIRYLIRATMEMDDASRRGIGSAFLRINEPIIVEEDAL